ncbi:MAG TPA: serine--tRNA ligase, partial [Prolixibacteraceae bacterium]|nr:serine--tRNA ligase [Prolixibacteraceae bacterium]
MLNLKFIQENPELVIERLAVKRFDARAIVEKVIALYLRRNEVQIVAEAQKAEMNQLSKVIGQLFKDGKAAKANSAKEKTVEIKDQIKNLESEFDVIDTELAQLQVLLPNLPSPLVPVGKGAEDNLIVATGGVMPVLPEGAKPHWELATQYDLIDFELGVKITGAGFPVYKGYGARIQRALINFFLDQAREHGYLEVQPP